MYKENIIWRNKIENIINNIDYQNKQQSILNLKIWIGQIHNEIQILELQKKYKYKLNLKNKILKVNNSYEVRIDKIISDKDKLLSFFNYLLKKKSYLDNILLNLNIKLTEFKNLKQKNSKIILILQKEILQFSNNKSFNINFRFGGLKKYFRTGSIKAKEEYPSLETWDSST